MTNELIAILATGVALLVSIGAMWFSMQREIGGVRSEVGDVRSEMAGLNRNRINYPSAFSLR